jgi:hypothetical protein
MSIERLGVRQHAKHCDQAAGQTDADKVQWIDDADIAHEDLLAEGRRGSKGGNPSTALFTLQAYTGRLAGMQTDEPNE